VTLRAVTGADLPIFFEHQRDPEATTMAVHSARGENHAYVALVNARSIRVLKKCGFRRVSEPVTGPDGVAEVLYIFDDGV